MKFLYAVLLTTLLCFTQDDKKDQIQWSATYKLQWTDFMGSPAGSLKAMTWSTIALETKKIDATGITLNINAFFIKSQSWRQKDFTDDFVLGHEQTHFNIAEVYTRKLRKKISQTKYSDTKKAMQEIQKTYNETFADLKAYQKKYDEETKHSINKVEQVKWNKAIEAELQSLNAFSGGEISVVIK